MGGGGTYTAYEAVEGSYKILDRNFKENSP
jgi:hypothetical protein